MLFNLKERFLQGHTANYISRTLTSIYVCLYSFRSTVFYLLLPIVYIVSKTYYLRLLFLLLNGVPSHNFIRQTSSVIVSSCSIHLSPFTFMVVVISISIPICFLIYYVFLTLSIIFLPALSTIINLYSS